MTSSHLAGADSLYTRCCGFSLLKIEEAVIIELQNKTALPEVLSSGFDFSGSYQPYYLLELPDHTYIVAQIPKETARAIENGERVTLPIGQKVSTTRAARNELSAVCAQYGADPDNMFYAFNDKWQEEHQFIFFLLRFGAAALLWFVLTAGLTLVGGKVFNSEEEARISS